MNEYTKDGKAICQLCGKPLHAISGHLATHKISTKTYKMRFPSAPLVSKSYGKGPASVRTSTPPEEQNILFLNNEKGEDVIENDEMLDSQKIKPKKPKPEIEELVKLKKDLKDRPPVEEIIDPTGNTPKTKMNVLKFLKGIFPHLKNNYMIEKFTLGGLLEYQFITDAADPISKIDFEFDNAFWHNIQNPPNHLRDSMLERDGWKIYRIKAVGPTDKDLMKLLDVVTD